MMWKFVGASKASVLYIYIIIIIIIIIKTTSFKEKDEIHSHGCVWACEESMGDVKLHSQLVVV